MLIEKNKAIVQRYFEELVNQGNLSVAAEIIASHCIEEVNRLVMMIHTAFPDFSLSIENQIAEEDKVATMFIASGTHQGETSFAEIDSIPTFFSTSVPLVAPQLGNQKEWPIAINMDSWTGRQFTIPATGKKFTYMGIRVFRINNEKIVETWGGWLPQVQKFIQWAHP